MIRNTRFLLLVSGATLICLSLFSVVVPPRILQTFLGAVLLLICVTLGEGGS